MKNKVALSWLINHANRYKGMIGLITLLQMLISGGAVCYAIIMKYMVDSAVAGERHRFFMGILAFGGLVVIQILMRLVLRYLEEFTRSELENSLKKQLFKSVLKKNYANVTEIHSEEWMNRITSDSTVCANGITDILPGLLGMVVKLCGALGMIFYLQPRLSYIIIPCGILFIGVTLIFRKYLKRFHKELQEKDGEVRVYFQERISSMLVLRTFGMEERAISGADESLRAYRNARMKKNIISNLCNTGFLATINCMYLLGIGYCGYGILNGTVSYGTLTAMIQLIGQLQMPLANMSGYVPRYYSMLASAERLMEVEQYDDVDVISVKSLEDTKRFYKNKMQGLCFDNVSFSYKQKNEHTVLSNVSFFIRKGSYVALTGDSGCGKSTLLKLLMGVYEPEKGSICAITNDNEKMPIKEWRRQFAYVPQGNFLMSGTIRDVITFGCNNKEQEMTVERALYLACADFVKELPEGVDTLLLERGSGLSEGQMQRIAIARALYSEAPVLILDEATSALDEKTERIFLERMQQLTDKTILIVTHRRTVLDECKGHLSFVSNQEGIVEIRYEENKV